MYAVVSVPSCFTTREPIFIPEPPLSSTTVNTTGCLLFVTYAPEVGEVIVITGFTVSCTTNLKPDKVSPVTVVDVPAVFVAVTEQL